MRLGVLVMVAPERAAILKQQIRAAVDGARTLQGALRNLADVFRRDRPSLIRLSVRSFDPRANTVQILAAWTATETAIGAGVKTSATATSMLEIIRTGKPVFEENAQAHYLDHLLRAEGINSWVSIPLRDGRAIRGLLSLSSREVGAFRPEDESFFAEVGSMLEKRLFELAGDGGLDVADDESG